MRADLEGALLKNYPIALKGNFEAMGYFESRLEIFIFVTGNMPFSIATKSMLSLEIFPLCEKYYTLWCGIHCLQKRKFWVLFNTALTNNFQAKKMP